MDMRSSRVILILALIGIAWVSKNHWIPKLNHSAAELFVEQPPTQAITLDEYPRS